MLISKFSNNKYTLELEKDELIIASLENFVKEISIGFARVEIIRTVKNTTLGLAEIVGGNYWWKNYYPV